MASPEHFWTDPLGSRYRFNKVAFTVIETRYVLNSADYTAVWVEWLQQSVDGNNTDVYFEVDDGVNPPVVSTTFTTALLAWQDSTLRVINIAGLNNTICTVKVYVKGNGRVRGIVGLLA